ncbi:MAG: hypothetical protein IPF72_09300 [Chitinophagaceae bacterium]|nr:hypothetical protein [Chitinophagaceae bacterium]
MSYKSADAEEQAILTNKDRSISKTIHKDFIRQQDPVGRRSISHFFLQKG